VVTSPVDIATQYVADTFGLPQGQVFGTGTVLDTARLRWRLAERLGRNVANAHGHVLGEHGDSCVIPWSWVSSREKFSPEEKKQLHEDVKKSGAKIIAGKGATYLGIGSVVAELIDAVISDSRRLYPVSVPLHGEYGIDGISIGVPCPVGEHGVEKVVEMALEPEELKLLQSSAKILQDLYKELR
jgi:L-lactate dehydrogenase